ncbi:MAG: hypothetical protein ACOC2U_02485 [bacterium]
MKWLKKLIKEVLEEVISERKFLPQTLSKDDVNIVYVDVGRMPKSKADQYIKDISKRFREANPEYKVMWLTYSSK